MPDLDAFVDHIDDDVLRLVFLTCHPALSPESRAALTLRLVGGLTVPEIARAFLTKDATVGQRISRAKNTLAGESFDLPTGAEREARLDDVMGVLYLIFNEGYTATSGAALQRTELAGEAIRLTRTVRRLLPDDGEVAGLLALMLLTDARRAARTGPHGELISLDEQDRGLWNKAQIEEGVALVTRALHRRRPGPYQLRAAIAAVHDEAPAPGDTDWREILGLYDLLIGFVPGPVERLNRVVAVARVHGPEAALAELAPLAEELSANHRYHAVRAHLLEESGHPERARAAYELAAARTLSLPEQRYLQTRAARLGRT